MDIALTGKDVELDVAAAVLPHAIDWRKRGTKGRFTVKDRVAVAPTLAAAAEPEAVEAGARLSRATSSIDASTLATAMQRGRNTSMPSVALNEDLEQFVREQEEAEQIAAAAVKAEASQSSFGAPAKMRMQSQRAPPSPVANSALSALQKRREIERQRSVSAGPRVPVRQATAASADSVDRDAGAGTSASAIAPTAAPSTAEPAAASASVQAATDVPQRLIDREKMLMEKKQQIEDMKKQYKRAMQNTTDPTELIRVQERISKVNGALETVSSELMNIRLEKVKSVKRQSSRGSRLTLTSSGGSPAEGLASSGAREEGAKPSLQAGTSPQRKRVTVVPPLVSTFSPATGTVLALPDALGSKILLLWKKWVPGGGEGSGKTVAALFGELVNCPSAPQNVRQLVVQLLDKLSLDNSDTMLQTELAPALVTVVNDKSSDSDLCGAVVGLFAKLLGHSQANKGHFLAAGGMFGLLTHLERKRAVDVEQTGALIYSLLQCKGLPAKDSFRAAQGVLRAVDLLPDAPPLLTAGVLKLLIVVSLTQEEKLLLVSDGVALPPLVTVITGRSSHAMQSIKMAGVLVASLSALPQSRQYIASNVCLTPPSAHSALARPHRRNTLFPKSVSTGSLLAPPVLSLSLSVRALLLLLPPFRC